VVPLSHLCSELPSNWPRQRVQPAHALQLLCLRGRILCNQNLQLKNRPTRGFAAARLDSSLEEKAGAEHQPVARVQLDAVYVSCQLLVCEFAFF
jgi:hypothetical protein